MNLTNNPKKGFSYLLLRVLVDGLWLSEKALPAKMGKLQLKYICILIFIFICTVL